MPYPIDETFATGIPAGFAHVGGNATGFSATHNATAEAVDLVFGAYQTFWHMLQADFADDFWFELDVELVSKTAAAWHLGFWLYSNTATSATGNYEGHRLAHNLSGSIQSWQRSSWTNGGSEYSSVHGTEFREDWLAAGQRRTLRVDGRRVQTQIGGRWYWIFSVTTDGNRVMYECRRDFASLRPAIFGYGCTLRVHGIKGAIGSAITLGELPAAGVGRAMLGSALPRTNRGEERVGAAGIRKMPANLYRHNILFCGGGKITGTVKQKAGSTNTPVWRRVVLVDEKTLTVVRETWSDPVTGAYSFTQVALGRPFTVFSYDHTGGFRAVVADSVVAVPL